VTGDRLATAIDIATQAGIISNPASVHRASDLMVHNHDNASLPSLVITGAEFFETLNSQQKDTLYAYQEIIFARTTSKQKQDIVGFMQARGDIVAVMGDAVTDAPALRTADCGIATRSGSDIAREAADIVLLEDFSAIVVALEHGASMCSVFLWSMETYLSI
jgi:sodium/potassium-transporting ATPase subunit alpha